MHDLVIRGGSVVDGTGAPARVADVAIDAGRISVVGEVAELAREKEAKDVLEREKADAIREAKEKEAKPLSTTPTSMGR